MERLSLLYKDLINNGLVSAGILYAITGSMLLLFIVQLYYYLGVYGKIARFRNNRGIQTDTPSEPVSVIVVIRESTYYYLENLLPLLLSQDYEQYEVVAVDCSYSEDIEQILEEMSATNSHLKVTQIRAQHNVEHSIKLALTVGIKASSYENLIFTTVDSYPTFDKWLSLMAKGFISGEVVIGYCGIEPKKGFANKWMRWSRMMTSVRYLAAAIENKPYSGTAHNLGYTKSLYFDNKGFNYLNMNVGDDDLFVRKISEGRSVSVVMNPKATMRQIQYGGLNWWTSMNKSLTYTYRYYPAGVRFKTSAELWSRFLFFASIVLLFVFLPSWLKIIPGFFLILRLLLVELKIWRICKRLGESKLMRYYFIYDLLSPLTELILAVSRRVRPNKTIWR